jgi:hypothetical protein
VRSLEFKPDVTVRIEYNEDTGVRVSANGAQFHWPAHSKPGPHEEQLYPGFTERFDDICKPLGENEAWIAESRWLVEIQGEYVRLFGRLLSLDEVRHQTTQYPDPEGWPRVLAIAERLLAEREPKLEARWEGDLVLHPGAWEKHVLPCILKNRPLADNEYRQDDGRMI